jgi:peptide chain release factor
MTGFAVSEEKNKWLRERMKEMNILEDEILEKFIRSSGPGGQKINKTSSCVYLKHLPTGLEVKCMRDRSQSVNRFLARRELVEKMAGVVTGRSKNDMAKERAKKQKTKRKKRSSVKYGRPEMNQLVGRD